MEARSGINTQHNAKSNKVNISSQVAVLVACVHLSPLFEVALRHHQSLSETHFPGFRLYLDEPVQLFVYTMMQPCLPKDHIHDHFEHQDAMT